MTDNTSAQAVLPAVDYLKLPEGGEPYLEGSSCPACGSIFAGARKVCAKCGARDAMETIRLADTGKLYVYCVVHRSFPGIKTPYISAVVNLDGGGTVKGILLDVEPDPDKIAFDMPVKVVYQDALGRKDAEGNSYISYFFQPAG